MLLIRSRTARWLRLGSVLVAALAAMALAPSAFAATFTVNVTDDADDANGSAGNGTCDTVAGAPETCTLRAAITEANAAVNPGADTINFDPAVFTGNAATSTIVAAGPAGPAITETVTIDGGDCDPSAAFKPCVGFQAAGTAVQGLIVGGDNVVIRGLAVTNGGPGVNVGAAATGAVIAGNWFGLRLDETAQGNSRGILLTGDTTAGDNHTVGGETPADRNVFGHNNDDAVRISGADDVTIKGNYFGTKPNGTTAAPNGGTSGTDNIEVSSVGGLANPASNVMIGGTQSAAQLASPECDGPCNVIANSSDGVDLETEGGTEGSPVSTTTIKGNYVGLDRTGEVDAGNNNQGIRASTSDSTNKPLTVGGPDPGDRNVISGNTQGGLLAASGATVRNNYFGSNSDGDAAIPQMFNDLMVGINQDNPTSLVQDNRFVGNGSAGGRIFLNGGTVVLGNTFGIGTGGEVLAPAAAPVTSIGNYVELGGSDPGEGNTIGNVPAGEAAIKVLGGEHNQIRRNLIGVMADGTAVPNGGPGILITNSGSDTALNNSIGGVSEAEENVISNSAGDAIEILNDNPALNGSNDGNTVLRNRGANNGSTAMDLFIDLRTDMAGDGPGNPSGAGPNAGIQEPSPDEPTTTQMTGSGMPDATVRVFKTFTEINDDVRGFAGQATVPMTGPWTVMFGPPLPTGQCLSANQTNTAGNSSEIAQPGESIGPDPCDVTGPTITIDSGPSGATNDPTADFAFSSEAETTFECRVDGAPFGPCDDQTGPTGAHTSAPLADGPHTFDVRGTDAIGNLGPTASRAFNVDTTPPPAVVPPGGQPAAAPVTTAKKRCKKGRKLKKGKCVKKKRKKRR